MGLFPRKDGTLRRPYPDGLLDSLDSRPGNVRLRRAYLGILSYTGVRIQFRACQAERRAGIARGAWYGRE